jgi:hypothetical protein
LNDCYERAKKGWISGDIDLMLGAFADDFVYDDPIDGRITKAQFADYYRGLPDGELVFSDEVEQEAKGETSTWFWWAWKRPGETGWAQEGSGLARSDANGLHSERITYYKR